MTESSSRVSAERDTILGVDPGSRCTGWGLIGMDGSSSRLLDHGVIRLDPARQPLSVRLSRLQRELTELLARIHPSRAAVEAPFHGINARSALQLAHARGVVLAVLGSAGIAVTEYSPATVKQSVTGNGRATKGQVQAMVVRLLGLDRVPASTDSADALAVALCCAAGRGLRAAIRRAEEHR